MQLNYTYAGLQNGLVKWNGQKDEKKNSFLISLSYLSGTCRCGFVYGLYNTIASCGKPCTNNPFQICGNDMVNSIYMASFLSCSGMSAVFILK